MSDSASAVSFLFRPSRQVGALLLFGWVCATAGVLIIPIPLSLRITAAVVITAMWSVQLRRHSWRRGRGAVHGLYFQPNGKVCILNPAGETVDFGDPISGFASPLLSTLIIKNAGGKTHTALITPDTLPPDSYRRLRIHINAARPHPDDDNDDTGTPTGNPPPPIIRRKI